MEAQTPWFGTGLAGQETISARWKRHSITVGASGAYVSIRQHTFRNLNVVKMLMHTSAYVSIRFGM